MGLYLQQWCFFCRQNNLETVFTNYQIKNKIKKM